MKKLSLIVLLAAFFCTTFSSCRKGEGYPFLSFRSRKSRLEGHWKIVKGAEKYTKVNSSNVSSISISDNAYTKMTAGSIVESGSITLEYDFTKDGDYSFIRVEEYGSHIDSITGSGNWTFLSGRGNLKNKEAILLTQLSLTISNGSVQDKDFFTKNNEGTIWVLNCLKNNYLVIDSEVDHNSPNPYSQTIHYEFKQ